MGLSCCIRTCKSDKKRRKKKPMLFTFPNASSLRKKWFLVIGNRIKNIGHQENLRICEEHFQNTDFQSFSTDSNTTRRECKKYLKQKRLLPEAEPSIFLDDGSECSQSGRSTDAEVNDIVMNIDDLKQKCKEINLHDFSLVEDPHDSSLWFFFFDFSIIPPSLCHSVKVFANLTFQAFCCNEIIQESVFSSVMSHFKSIVSIRDFVSLLSTVRMCVKQESPLPQVVKSLNEYAISGSLDDTKAQKLNFLVQQLSFIDQPPGPRNPYPPSLLTTAIMWKATSTAGYKTILKDEVLTLPSLSTLGNVAMKVASLTSDIEKYLSNRMSKLEDDEKRVILMFDEIYVYQNLDFTNGAVVGLVTDANQSATSVLCFMIKSLKSGFSDVVAMVPLCGINLPILSDKFHTVLKVVVDCGFDVIAVVCDNHPVNRSLLNSLSNKNPNASIENPVRPGSPLFLLVDPTHTIKNIYNNFQKAARFSFKYDNEVRVAKFAHIKQIYEMEGNKGLRMAHKLNKIVISPTSIQRSSAKLSMAVFHDSTASALKYYVENGHPEFLGTLYFVKMIIELIKIVNIKSCFVGKRRNDPLKFPISQADDHRLERLIQFKLFFEEWKQSRLPGLTTETSFAAINMCCSVYNITLHLLTIKSFKYVLTGYFQSDPIEARFVKYRQMSGANFFISVKQLMESEKKIKLVSLLKSSGITLAEISMASSKESPAINTTNEKLFIDVEECPPVTLASDEIQVVYYVAGYSSRKAKKLSCENCRLLFMSTHHAPSVDPNSVFFDAINRGKLQAPSDQFFSFCCKFYELFCRLKHHTHFFQLLASSNPFSFFFDLLPTELHDPEYSFECCDYHDCHVTLSRCMHSFFNTLCLNYVRTFNCQPNDGRKWTIARIWSSSIYSIWVTAKQANKVNIIKKYIIKLCKD